MGAKQAWITRMKNEFERSPLVSNLFLGFILVFLEKLVEVEFACPCDSKWNALFSASFFVVPAFLVFLLMLNIRGCKKCSALCWENVLFSLVPAFVWLTLVFFDGQYFACARTTWSGRFVALENASLQKWCKPNNHNSSQELLIQTEKWFSMSQGIGMGFTIALTLGLLVHVIYSNCFKKETSQVSAHQDPRTSSPLNNQDAAQMEIPDSGDIPLQEI